MLLLERIIARFIDTLSGIIILVRWLTYNHLTVLSVIVSLFPAAGRLLVADPNLIFLVLVRLRWALTALLSLDGQAALQVLGELKSRHVHGLQSLFLAWQLVFTGLLTTAGVKTRYHRVGVRFECRLHHVLLFGVGSLLFHKLWWVGTQALVGNGRERLLRGRDPFTVYSFKDLLPSGGDPAMPLFTGQGSDIFSKW